ncbi:hypothetical protein [Nocardia wallacei]|uniref:hypothetical protein n=1 Tax=Nocardia wallacei TaxID=480035 RepID=UPI002456673C|nr:hypothetical protein [Nocardia wallacei]
MSMAHTEESRPGRRRLRSRFRRHLLLLCTVVACLGILVPASKPAGTELMSLSPSQVLGAAFVVIVVWTVAITYLILAVRSRRLRVPELGSLAAPVLIIALTAISWRADLPMTLRWQLSAHAFEDVAQQVNAGADPRTFEGDRLGLYRIRGVERLDDGVYFRTGPMGSYCSMGSGFADLSGHQPETSASHHLSGDWYWFCFTSASVAAHDHALGEVY